MRNFPCAVAAAVLALIVLAPLRAQDPGPLAPFQPPPNRTPVVRLWGDRFMSALACHWAEGFHVAHPEWSADVDLLGDGTGMPALYTGLADVALFGRDLITTDIDGFSHVLKYPHVAIELGTGSLDEPGKSPAPVIFVHRDNPLAQLTLAQLDAIFGAERRRGAPAAIRTWGELGLTGEWRDRPIKLYGDETHTGTSMFFQRLVMLNSRKFNWECFTEFKNVRRPDGTMNTSAAQSLAALRADRFGLAVANLHEADAEVKPLPLAAAAGGPFFTPTRDACIARTYPLARPILACVNRPPGQPLDPKVRDFLRYVLSAEGQRAFAREGAFLPLSESLVREQLKKIE
jgi:phosphate transport system substrate-binding protein